MTKRAAVVLMLVACTKHEEQPTTSVAVPPQPQLPSASVTTSIPAPTATDAGMIVPVPITACTVTFSCGLSHPGLGSSSRTTSVDLGKCERASWSESGPYNPTSPRNPPKKTITKLAKAACDHLTDLASSLGQADSVG